MSILIKGMEMPESCSDCFLDYDSIVCMALNKEFPDRSSDDGFYAYCSGRMPDCPLIELPPHGRLIDADALMLRIQEYIDEYGWDVDEHGFHSEKWCAMKETEMAINDAPTVIPADKDGEI